MIYLSGTSRPSVIAAWERVMPGVPTIAEDASPKRKRKKLSVSSADRRAMKLGEFEGF
jgi:hypothetical protein